MSKVLVITPQIKPGGGPPGYVFNLMRGIDELEVCSQVINKFTFKGELNPDRSKSTLDPSVFFKIRKYLVSSLKKLGLKKFLSFKNRELRKLMDKNDLVIFQGYQDIDLMKYALKKKILTVYMPHSPTPASDEYRMLAELSDDIEFKEELYFLYERNEEYLIKNANFVVFPTKNSKTEYKKYQIYLEKKIVYIKSGVFIDNKFNGTSEVNAAIKVAFIGRFVSHKGYDIFCEAAKLYSNNYNNQFVNFYTVGEGPMIYKYPELINLGWRSDVFDIISGVDIIVIPNRVSYFDLLPIECAALGKPLIMTKVGGSIDQLNDLIDSIAFEELTPESLMNAMVEAIKIKKMNPNWGINNKLAYERLYTTKSFASRWDLAVTQMINNSA